VRFNARTAFLFVQAEGTMDQPTENQIRERAHQLWEAAGKPEGRHEEFWQQAERELRGSEDFDSPDQPK
jgi:hypothetical protein